MKTHLPSMRARAGFTLTEILVAIVILSLIVLTVAFMITGAQRAITFSRRLLDSDDQARLALGRMQDDMTRIVKRADVDFISAKQSGNDEMFFYSQSVGDTSNGTPFPNGVQNPVSLIGFRVAADPNIKTNIPADLQRLGRGLNWLASSTLPATDNMVFLSPATTTQIGPSPYSTSSTISGHWTTSVGTAPTYAGTDADYHVLGDQIFRFEFCYLLKDGSYGDYPVEANSSNVPTGAVPLIVLTRAPTATDDGANTAGAGTAATGTRWFDNSAGRAYLCVSAATGAAVWQAQGVQDVAAVVVAIVLLDRNSRTLLNAGGGTTAELATLFPDSGFQPTGTGSTIAYHYTAANASSVSLMQNSWMAVINASGFGSSLQSATGVPAALAQQLASHISVYQRYIYLNTASSL